MSKYGEIIVDVKKHFTSDQLKAFAEENGLSYDEAEGLARELIYRKMYNKLRNKNPEVRAKRKEYNQKRHQLTRILKSL